jgi:hypothetical protein
MRPRQIHQRLPGLRLHIRRVDHGQPTSGQPLAGDVVQHVERVTGDRLVVLIPTHQAPAEIAGDHLERAELFTGEGRLARPGNADQHDERDFGHSQRNGLTGRGGYL